jgi:molybdenum cofactor guanylyltransferase
VLTGGRSSRMGRDKALLEVHGTPMGRIAADALLDAGACEVFAVGGDVAGLAGVGLRTVADRWPGEGPLGGLVTALDEATTDLVVVLACDLPAITAEAVGAVVGAIDRADAAVPLVGAQPQHLLAAWRRSTALHHLQAAFTAGERAIWRAVQGLAVNPVTLRVAIWAQDADNADAEVFRARPRVHRDHPPG